MVALNTVYQSAHNYETGARVELALNTHHAAKFQGVRAIAFCGIVELSGIVATHDDKAQAIRVARRVSGISTVVESLRIDDSHGLSPSFRQRSMRSPGFLENSR